MGLLTAAAILAAKDLAPVTVAVPEWGGEVLVRGLRGVERDAFEAGMYKTENGQRVPNPANVRARLAVMCCVDEKGERLFSDDDIEALGQRSGAAIDRIYDAAARLSGLIASKADAAKND